MKLKDLIVFMYCIQIKPNGFGFRLPNTQIHEQMNTYRNSSNDNKIYAYCLLPSVFGSI